MQDTRKPAPAACPACGGRAIAEFLNRACVPVHQHLLMSSRTAARAIARGTLAMRACRACGFVFNAAFDPSLLNYGERYDNVQTCSPAFNDYVDGLVDHLCHERGVSEARIVEVGCGQGTFLRKLIAVSPRNQALGFDPSYRGPEVESDGRLRFVKGFFDGQGIAFSPDVVVCRHVIEHVERPIEFLQGISTALANAGSKHARVFFETPCVEWILRNRVVWDFFYEHCSLFDPESLARVFATSGFEVAEVRHVFGGQYLWIEANWTPDGARPHLESIREPSGRGGQSDFAPRSAQNRDSPRRFSDRFLKKNIGCTSEINKLAEAYARDEMQQLHRWRQQTERLRTEGRLALWGAGAKGVTLANLIDPDGELIDCLVDVNPAKQGNYLPGSGHAIVSPEQLGPRRVTKALVLNSNYVDEIRRSLADLGLQIKVIDMMKEIQADSAWQERKGTRVA